MSEVQVSPSDSTNCSDSEESCSSTMKLEEKTAACGGDALPPSLHSADGAAAGQCDGGNTVKPSGLAEGLDKLLQKQRSDLLFELRKLQHGHRPVTNTDRRETLEEFFSDALQSGDQEIPQASVERQQARQQARRPESVLSEVQGLSERRPVTSVLGSQSFRRNLEDVIRGTLVRQDHELQRAIRLRSAGFNPGTSARAAPSTVSSDTYQQHIENLSQLSHSSQTSSSSNIGLADVSVFSPPLAPPLPAQGMPIQPQMQPSAMQPVQLNQQQWQQQQPWQQPQYSQWQQQQQQAYQWQQQLQPWQQQSQPWQQHPQPWQQFQHQPFPQQQQFQGPVLPQQPWLTQNSNAQQPNAGGTDTVAFLQNVHREETVFEISDVVQRQVVSSVLNSEFRGTLENTLLNHLQRTGSDGLSVQNYIQSLPQSTQHRRNDFSHLGIQAPSRQSQFTPSASASASATWAGPEMERMRQQMEEMQTMLRLTFELQLDMQRSIRQEVAAALIGQSQTGPNNPAVNVPIPPSQPASEGQCVICLEKSVDSVLYQCGHMCCCLSCGLRLKTMGAHCPMCRAPIRDVIRAYRCQRD